MIRIPARVDALALGAALELLHGDRANVLEVVGARVGDDGIPDDGRVGHIVGSRPFGSNIDEDLLRVPVEEAREVGVEGEADDGVLFLLGGVVVRAALNAIMEILLSARLLTSSGASWSASEILTLAGCRP